MSFQHRDAVLKRIKRDRVSDRVWFMVGSPGQTFDTLYDDLQFILELQPHMVGIGPFIPQQDTPFGGECAGTLDRTLRLLQYHKTSGATCAASGNDSTGNHSSEGGNLVF